MRVRRNAIRQYAHYLVLTIFVILAIACQQYWSSQTVSTTGPTKATPTLAPVVPRTQQQPMIQPVKLLDRAQLVDIGTVNPNIRLDIRYATTLNFAHRQLYSVPRCLLRAAVAEALSEVQADLEQQGLGLKVYDCYRPLSIQKQMWKLVPDSRFVANPAQGSRHNRGSAVDVTLVDRAGNELEMPSDFDDFTEHAYANYSGGSAAARDHRRQLRMAMVAHGFIPLQTEWWHFDAPDWQQFPTMDVPLEAVR